MRSSSKGRRTLGIRGLGTIGSKVARIGQAFGMHVIAFSPNLTTDRAAAVDAVAVTKPALFEQSDLVSVHMILSDRTRGIVGASDLERMKPTAFLINRIPMGLEASWRRSEIKLTIPIQGPLVLGCRGSRLNHRVLSWTAVGLDQVNAVAGLAN